jgi:hypothetical protein
MKVVRVLKMIVVFAVAALVLSFVVMWLWNRLVPGIFGWKAITYWQAAGLMVLSKILFGGFHRHGGRGGRGWKERREWKRRMKEKFEHMTPEERERFRAAVKDRWGGRRCGPWGDRHGWDREEVKREPEVKG